MLIAGLVFNHLVMTRIHAQERLQVDIEELEQTLSDELTKANDAYLQLQRLTTEMAELNNQKIQLQQAVEEQQSKIVERQAIMKKRLQALQLSGYVQQSVIHLLQAESLADFFNRWSQIHNLFQSDGDALRQLKKELLALDDTQKGLTENEAQLFSKQQTKREEATKYERMIAQLKQLMIDHRSTFEQMREKQTLASPSSVATFQVSQGERENHFQNDSADSINTSKESVAPSSNGDSFSKNNVDENALPNVEQSSAALLKRLIAVEATAYSYKEAGLSYYTALGIDLRKNPNVIAVDPRVIPLGTIVEIPGYGLAIAGDTGGAISGNRIDIHYPNEAQVQAFGRKQLVIQLIE